MDKHQGKYREEILKMLSIYIIYNSTYRYLSQFSLMIYPESTIQ